MKEKSEGRCLSKSSHNRLHLLARALAAKDAEFQSTLGPGLGDHRTSAFIKSLRALANKEFGHDHAEQKICGDSSFAVDYYFRDEATIVEIALGLPNPNSEFEKDILKALMAVEAGNPVRHLIFISRPGGVKKCSQPGRAGIIRWARAKHRLNIEILDLDGEPRRRARRKKAKI
jgi:hypothetical protein